MGELDTQEQSERKWQYDKYIHSPAWKNIAENRKQIDGNQCVICGSKENLSVHHRTYERLGCENINDDLITLCDKCHRLNHNLYGIPGYGFAEQYNRYAKHEIYKLINKLERYENARKAKVMVDYYTKTNAKENRIQPGEAENIVKKMESIFPEYNCSKIIINVLKEIVRREEEIK